LSDAAERAYFEWSRLKEQWDATRVDWRDDVAKRFEKDFWQSWETEVPKFLCELHELEDTLDQALNSMR
jgi:hypothetical protein